MLSYQSPNIIPIQRSVTAKPILRVLVDTLQQASYKVVRHSYTSPGNLSDNVPHDAQSNRKRCRVMLILVTIHSDLWLQVFRQAAPQKD